MREQTRSGAYQWTILEVTMSDLVWSSFSNQDSLNYALNPFDYNEDVLELYDELKIEFWKLVEEVCTPRQKEVMRLLCTGLTQQEIAKELNVNQSSVTKSINGNKDYGNGVRIYGGVIKKLKKHVEKHKRIQEILAEIKDIEDNRL